jgi:hypothetical protein
MPSSFHSTAAGAHPAERVGDVGRRGGEHRLHRLSDDQPEGGETGHAVSERCLGHRPQRAAHHRRVAHIGQGHLGSAGHSVDHHAFERTLPQLAR